MAGTRGVTKSKASAASARSHRLGPVRTDRPTRSGLLSTVIWGTTMLLPLAAIVAPVLIFIFSPTVRDWALGALGYGLLPVALWLASIILAFRYRNVWVTRFWRVWVGSAVLVVGSLGVMSMLHASDGVLEEASLGGRWGQYFGGSPIALGSLKLAVLSLLAPLLLFPRRTAVVYRQFGRRVLRAWFLTMRWLAVHLARAVKSVAGQGSSAQPGRQERSKLVRRVSVLLRKWWRSIFGVPRSKATATVGSLEVILATETTSPDRKGHAKAKASVWQFPSIELLNRGEDRQVPQPVLQQMAQHIEDTLAEHKVEVAVEDIRSGPRVIRFGLVPGWVRQVPGVQGAQDQAQR